MQIIALMSTNRQFKAQNILANCNVEKEVIKKIYLKMEKHFRYDPRGAVWPSTVCLRLLLGSQLKANVVRVWKFQ